MKEGYVIRDQNLPHFLTITIVDWIDVFSRKIYRDCVIECFDYCIKNKRMILYSYVIMSNHIHMIVQSNEGKLSDLIRDFKKYTSKTILEKIKPSYAKSARKSSANVPAPQSVPMKSSANVSRLCGIFFTFIKIKRHERRICYKRSKLTSFFNYNNCELD
jgi:REP element-mobilizing transposase RayT